MRGPCLGPYGHGPLNTTRHHKTRRTVPCEVVYPWHPWFAQAAWVHGEVVKNEALLRCSLQTESTVRTLEIPKWMLDGPRCCRMRLQSEPLVGVTDLCALKQLLQQTVHPPDRLEDPHRSSTREGDADAKSPSSADATPGPVPSTSANADLGPIAGTGEASRSGTAGASARGGTKTKAGPRARPGGRH